MKATLPLLMLLVLLAGTVSAQWTQQASPTTNNLLDIAFLNAKTGYAVGAKGTVLRTKNGGKQWKLMKAPDNGDLTSVTILDSGVIIVTSSGGDKGPSVYRSVNGGANWKRVLGDPLPFYAASTKKGDLFAVSKKIYESPDTGSTWVSKTKTLNSSSSYDYIGFSDKKTGIVAGNISGILTYSAEFYRSVTSGENWYPSDPFSFPNANAFSALSEVKGDSVFMFTNFYDGFQPGDTSQLILLSHLTLKRSSGDTIWFFKSKIIRDTFPDRINDCKFFDDGIAYALGDRGIYRSDNYGKKWTRELKLNGSMNSIYCLSEGKAFAAGIEGFIFIRENPAPPVNAVTMKNYEIKLYPNPASSNAAISFSLDSKSAVAVQVTDDKGLNVFKQKARSYGTGAYSVTINTSSYKPGLHYVNLIIDGKVAAKKELLIVK